MNLNDFGRNVFDDGKRARYEARIAEAKKVIEETEKKLAALALPNQLKEGLPRNTRLFLPLGDLRLASDGNLYVHPFSTLNRPNERTKNDVILVRVRSNKTLEVVAPRSANLLAGVRLADQHMLGWNRVTKFSTE